jgi:RHH-type rel operon transcriptional repressor/antitoxin RelB
MASIRLPDALEAHLAHVAKVTRRSKSFILREALEAYLEDVEDGLAVQEALAHPDKRVFTTQEVREYLALHHAAKQ